MLQRASLANLPTEFNVLRGLAQARVRADGRGWLCTGFPMKGPYADPVMEEGCVKPPGGCSGRASTGPSGAPSGATRGRRRDFREPASWRRNGGAVVAAPSVGRRSRLSTLPAKPALQVGVSSSWFQGLSTSTRLSIIERSFDCGKAYSPVRVPGFRIGWLA